MIDLYYSTMLTSEFYISARLGTPSVAVGSNRKILPVAAMATLSGNLTALVGSLPIKNTTR